MRAFITAFLLLLNCIQVEAQSALDSLESLHPIYDVQRIRRIIRSELSLYPPPAQSRIDLIRAALSEARQSADTMAIAAHLVRWGLLAYDYQHYNEAVQHFTTALTAYEQPGRTREKAFTLLWLADAYRFADAGVFMPVEELIREADSLAARTGDSLLVAAAAFRRASISGGSGREELLNKAERMVHALEATYPDSMPVIRESVRLLNTRGRMDEALRKADAAGLVTQTVFISNNLGDLDRQQGRYAAARERFLYSLERSKTNRLKTLLRNTYENLARLAWVQGRYEEAFRFRGLTMYLMESLWDDRAAADLAFLEIRYETEKKELQNSLLRTELAAREAALRQVRIQRLLLALLVLLALVILVLGAYSRGRFRRNAQELADKNRAIARQNTELAHLSAGLKQAQQLAGLYRWTLDRRSGRLSWPDGLPMAGGSTAGQPVEIEWDAFSVHPESKSAWDLFWLPAQSGQGSPAPEEIVLPDGKQVLLFTCAGIENNSAAGTAQDVTAARALTRARLEARKNAEFARQLLTSQEAERKRISAGLHDGIGQEMLLIRNQALLGLRKADGTLARHFEQIAETSARLVDNVRSIMYDLRPVQLDKLGLTETLRQTALLATSSAGLSLDAGLSSIDGLLSPEDEVHVFRILQELLSNSVKHAGASRITLHASVQENTIELVYGDNGHGFAWSGEAENRSLSFGMNNMQERAACINGQLRVSSEPGAGMQAQLTIPVPSAVSVIV